MITPRHVPSHTRAPLERRLGGSDTKKRVTCCGNHVCARGMNLEIGVVEGAADNYSPIRHERCLMRKTTSRIFKDKDGESIPRTAVSRIGLWGVSLEQPSQPRPALRSQNGDREVWATQPPAYRRRLHHRICPPPGGGARGKQAKNFLCVQCSTQDAHTAQITSPGR